MLSIHGREEEEVVNSATVTTSVQIASISRQLPWCHTQECDSVKLLTHRHKQTIVALKFVKNW